MLTSRLLNYHRQPFYTKNVAYCWKLPVYLRLLSVILELPGLTWTAAFFTEYSEEGSLFT